MNLEKLRSTLRKACLLIMIGTAVLLALFVASAIMRANTTARAIEKDNAERSARDSNHATTSGASIFRDPVASDDHSSPHSGKRNGKVAGTLRGPGNRPIPQSDLYFVSCDGLLQRLVSGELTARAYFTGARYEHTLSRSRDDGTFELDLPEGRYNLYAYRSGSAPASLSMIMVEDGRISSGHDIFMSEGAVLTGEVVGLDGKGVEKAVVSVLPLNWGPLHHRTETDQNGRFCLPDLPRESVLLEVHHPSFGSIVKTSVDLSKESEVKLAFDSPSQLAFSLDEASSSKSVRKCTISLEPLDEKEDWRLHRSWTLNNAEGNYILGGITPGLYTLRIGSEGFAPLSVDILFRPRDRLVGLRYSLREGERIFGAVTTQGLGTAVSNATLYLYDQRHPPSSREIFRHFHSRPLATAVSKVDGTYAFEHVSPGHYWLAVDHPSLVPTMEADVVVEDRKPARKDFSLSDGGTIFGRTPWPFTDVLVSSDAGVVRMTFSDQAGEFEIFGIPAGRCLVKAGSLNPSGRSYVPKGVVVKERATNTVRIHFQDEMAEGDEKGLLYGWIVDEQGIVLPNMQVYCQNMEETPRYLRGAKSDDSGVFYFAGIVPGGKYVLVVIPEGEKDAVRTLNGCDLPSDSRETRVDIVMGTHSLTASVTAKEKPPEGVTVYLYEVRKSEPIRLVAMRELGESPLVTFNRLPRGEYRLEARAVGYGSAKIKSIKVPPTDVRQTPWELTLAPGGTLELHFCGKDGSPKTGWTAVVLDSEDEVVFQFSRLCDEQGLLRIEGLQLGAYRIVPVRKDGTQVSELKKVLTQAGTSRVDIIVE